MFTRKREICPRPIEKSNSRCCSNLFICTSEMCEYASRLVSSGVSGSKPSRRTISPLTRTCGGLSTRRCRSEPPISIVVLRRSSRASFGCSRSIIVTSPAGPDHGSNRNSNSCRINSKANGIAPVRNCVPSRHFRFLSRYRSPIQAYWMGVPPVVVRTPSAQTKAVAFL